jgi:hypothetical protein
MQFPPRGGKGRGLPNYDTRLIERKSLAQKPLPTPSRGEGIAQVGAFILSTCPRLTTSSNNPH